VKPLHEEVANVKELEKALTPIASQLSGAVKLVSEKSDKIDAAVAKMDAQGVKIEGEVKQLKAFSKKKMAEVSEKIDAATAKVGAEISQKLDTAIEKIEARDEKIEAQVEELKQLGVAKMTELSASINAATEKMSQNGGTSEIEGEVKELKEKTEQAAKTVEKNQKYIEQIYKDLHFPPEAQK